MNEEQNLKDLAEKDLSKVIGGTSVPAAPAAPAAPASLQIQPAAGQADKFRICRHNCTEEKGKYPDCAGCLRNK